MTSVSPRLVDARVERSRTLTQPSPLPTHTGLISQVAEEIWEVKDRKIKNLTKEGITIVDYKNLLVKASMCQPRSAHACGGPLMLDFRDAHTHLTGYAALEKAKLFSKTTQKTKA